MPDCLIAAQHPVAERVAVEDVVLMRADHRANGIRTLAQLPKDAVV